MDKNDKLNKIINEIKDVLTPSMTHLFVGGDLVASEKTLKLIKDNVKKNYDPPKKNIKAYTIRIKINKSDDNIININCGQLTITPKLFIGPTDDDGSQLFIYTRNDLLKNGYKMSHIKKIIKAIKTDSISYDKNYISISELLNK